MARGVALSSLAYGPPQSYVPPPFIDLDHGGGHVRSVRAFQTTGRLGEDAARSALDAVDPGCNLSNGSVFPGKDQFDRHGFINIRRRKGRVLPVGQMGEGPGKSIGNLRVVNALHDHGGERYDEGYKDERDQR